ncbi:serine/threonine-protein kinase [Actinocorallia longicatena]|uniref:Protein kinase domain-containing protein n=1 Tax=Actinocorallia longicatena TaxID=111803 RepID=A0ABP6PVZ4_9ACTN
MAAPLEPGDPRRLGEYDLVRRLGEGGQGTVYLGIGPGGLKVAVKVLKGYTDPATKRRLEREFEAVKRVNPFCTAQVIAFHESYIVSEFVDGPSLQERIQQSGPLQGGDLVRLAVGTASALAAIHDAGVIHRDFKPANVLLGPDGPRVVDFGIARPVDAGTSTVTFGTPGYVPPELLRGEAISARSDLFGWAATIAFAATGRHPFSADTVALIYQRILTFEPDLSALPPELQQVLRSCLDKDPGRRPDAHVLVTSLISPSRNAHLTTPAPTPQQPLPLPQPQPFVQPYEQGHPQRTEPGVQSTPIPLPRNLRVRRRRRGPIVLGAAALAAVLVAAVLLWPEGERDKGAKPAPTTPTASVSTSAPPGVPAALAGTWTGTVTDNNNGSFGLTLTVNAGLTKGTFAATGGSTCDQPISFNQAQGAAAVRMNLEPADGCSGGLILLTLDGQTLRYRYDGGDIVGTANLTKSG